MLQLKPEYVFEQGWRHRADVRCWSCGGWGTVEGSECGICDGRGTYPVGCGGAAERNAYVANCLSCGKTVPIEELSKA